MTERDRDEFGRARSTRPRDALGRPLPRGSNGVPRIPDDLELPPAETLAYAQDLLDRGLAFNAHEVLEAAWKNGPDAERTLWQGLAQLAVGITHIQRGNVKGAQTLLRRGAGQLVHHRPAPHGIDTAGLIAHAEALLDDLESGAAISPERLSPRLVF
ncbi:DUF309 domain-containing protein [Mycolicibacterium sp. XJ870]